MPSSTFLRHKIHPAFYIPQPHETIEHLVTRLYGVQRGEQQLFNTLRNYTLLANPELGSAKKPFGFYVPRTLDFISHDPHYFLCSNPQAIEQRIEQTIKYGEFSQIDRARQATPQDATEREIYRFFAELSSTHQYADKLIGTGVGLISHMSGTKNQHILRQLATLHSLRQEGKINRRSFLLKKKSLIDAYTKAVGPLASILHGERNMRQGLQSGQKAGLSPSGQFVHRAEQLAKLAKKAKLGGVILTTAGAGMSIANMCAANTDYEKNVHLVKGVGALAGGYFGGVLAGLAISAVVVSGPVGWGLALVVSAGAATLAGDAGAKTLHVLYDQFGNKVDIATASGLTRLCR